MCVCVCVCVCVAFSLHVNILREDLMNHSLPALFLNRDQLTHISSIPLGQ